MNPSKVIMLNPVEKCTSPVNLNETSPLFLSQKPTKINNLAEKRFSRVFLNLVDSFAMEIDDLILVCAILGLAVIADTTFVKLGSTA